MPVFPLYPLLCSLHISLASPASAGGISPEYQPPVYSKDDRPLVSASRSGLLHFSHPYHKDYLPVFGSTPRLGATIQEQLGKEADERLGLPGQRVSFGLSLGLCKVYAEVSWPEDIRVDVDETTEALPAPTTFLISTLEATLTSLRWMVWDQMHT